MTVTSMSDDGSSTVDAYIPSVVQVENGVAEGNSEIIADSKPLALPVIFVPKNQKEGVTSEHQTRRLLQPSRDYRWL